MQWLTEYVWFHEAENSRQKDLRRKLSDVPMFWSLCAECIEFLSQRRSGAVLMESRHGEDQTYKQGLYQRKRNDRVLTTYTRYVLGWAVSEWSGLWKIDVSQQFYVDLWSGLWKIDVSQQFYVDLWSGLWKIDVSQQFHVDLWSGLWKIDVSQQFYVDLWSSLLKVAKKRPVSTAILRFAIRIMTSWTRSSWAAEVSSTSWLNFYSAPFL